MSEIDDLESEFGQSKWIRLQDAPPCQGKNRKGQRCGRAGMVRTESGNWCWTHAPKNDEEGVVL